MEKLFLYVEKRNIFPWFSQMVHLHFLTLLFVIRKCHGYGSKPWELRGVSMALLGRNPQGYEVEKWGEGLVAITNIGNFFMIYDFL